MFFICFGRIMFGSSHLYVFHHPGQAKPSTVDLDDISYEMAQEEIAQNSGIEMDKDDKSRGERELKTDISISSSTMCPRSGHQSNGVSTTKYAPFTPKCRCISFH